jgi:hypothetical protein
MRLIDWKRTGELTSEYYKKLRRLGYSDDLNIERAELEKKLGTKNLSGDEIDG